MAQDIGLLPSLALDGTGTVADQDNPRNANHINRHGIGDLVHSAGAANYDRIALQTRPAYNLPNAVEICPDPQKVKQNGGFNGSPDFALSQKPSWEYLNHQLNDVHSAAALRTGCDNPFCVWGYSWTSGHGIVNDHRLRDLQTKLPAERRVGSTVIPSELYLRERLGTLAPVPLTFWEDQLLLVTIVTDNNSKANKELGQPMVDSFRAFGIAQALAASSHDRSQKNGSDYFTALGAYSPICTMGWGTRRLLPGVEPSLYSSLRSLFHFAAHGYGIPEDIIDRTVEAALESIQNPARRGLSASYNPDQQGFCFISHPEIHDPTSDKRLVREIHAAIIRRVSERYPALLLQFLQCNGLPTPQDANLSPLWVTATSFWPVEFPPQEVLEQIHKPVSSRPPKLPRPDPRVTVSEVFDPVAERNHSHDEQTAQRNPAPRSRRSARVRSLPEPQTRDSA